MKISNQKQRLALISKLRLTLRLRYALPVLSFGFVLILLLYFNFGTPKPAKAGTETLSSGSYIINMGVTPQTYNNGLKPYGMIYDLIVNYNVPIKWIIEPGKVKDGTDFTYSGVNYKGGPFIVPAEYINSTVSGRITYWTSQGVSGVYTTSAISVPVYATLTNFPRTIIDDVSGKDGIITDYYKNASFPTTAYVVGTPSSLTYCHDLWINPHGDPNWTTHGYLYNLATVAKSYIWMECHAVSVTEGIANPASPFQKMNFLTTNALKCYSGNNCGTGVTETHGGNPTTPFTHYYPTDPVMQFMGTMDGATTGGSEKWYQPQSTGAWRSTTKRLVTTSDGASPNEGVVMVYGPAFGDSTNGYVMYEGGHDLGGNGTTAEKVAGQRAFFNFVLLAGYKKQLAINNVVIPSTGYAKEQKDVSLTVSGGSPAYHYQWSSNFGGSFIDGDKATAKFTIPSVAAVTNGVISCVVTDDCARQNFVSRPFVAYTTLPISLKSFTGKLINNRIELTWVTASEINNNYFSIERSSDGINFSSIGKVKGNNNSTIDLYYGFIDDELLPNTNYYRLKQIDYDEKFTYSKVISINTNKKTQESSELKIESVYPNPFRDNFQVAFHSNKESSIQIVLINTAGQILVQEKIDANEGLNTWNFFNGYNFKNGIYYLAIINNEEKTIQRILKN